MGFTSLQVCMDSSDWLQGTIHEETGMGSSSPTGDILTCSRPLIERRLRPPHDQALKCPRCDSTHTKFCYYNNYSLSQPRYFCKTCRRYWTKGGTLRNIPVGGGCRKNKKVSNKKSSSSSTSSNNDHSTQSSSLVINQSQNPTGIINPAFGNNNDVNSVTDLQLSSFSDHLQLSHLNNMLGSHIVGGMSGTSFMGLENAHAHHAPIDFMDNKFEAHNFMGNGDNGLGLIGGLGLAPNSFNGLCSPFGNMALDGTSSNSGTILDNCQRLMLPYENDHHLEDQNNLEVDVKPNPKLLSLDWHDQACSDAGKESPFGYQGGIGPWSGFINGYGPSSTNPLV